MTTNPDEPQQPGGTPPPPPGAGATPPPPPGAGTPPPAAQQPPAGGYQAPGGYQGAPPPGGGYGSPQGSYGGQPPLSDSDQRLWAMLAHLGGILFFFLAPLVIWLVFKDRGRYVNEQAKEALNFQILVAICWVAATILTIVTFGIASVLYLLLGLAMLVFGILAGVAANKGQPYRYPVNLRLVK